MEALREAFNNLSVEEKLAFWEGTKGDKMSVEEEVVFKPLTFPLPLPLEEGIPDPQLNRWFEDMERHLKSLQVNLQSPLIVDFTANHFSPSLKAQWSVFKESVLVGIEEEVTSLSALKEWARNYSLPGPSRYDHVRAFQAVRQEGNVKDYAMRYRAAIAALPSLPKELQIDFFIVGLKREVEEEVVRLEPSTLRSAIEAALLVEKRNQGMAATSSRRSSNKVTVNSKEEGTLTTSSSSTTMPRRRCTNCGRLGHTVEQCWGVNQERKPANKSTAMASTTTNRPAGN